MSIISGNNFNYDITMDEVKTSSESSTDTEVLSDSDTPVLEADEVEIPLEQKVSQLFPDQRFCHKELKIKYNDLDAYASSQKWLGHAIEQMKTESSGQLLSKLVEKYTTRKIKTSTIYGHAISHSKGKRAFMEDKACTFSMELFIAGSTQQAQVYALFDGHGKQNMVARKQNVGIDCAQYCKKNIQRVFKTTMESLCVAGKDFEIYDALKLSFVLLDEEFRAYRTNKFPRFKKPTFGTTACVSMILQNKLWVANVGDTRAFISNNERCIPLTYDAKAADPVINQSISKRNGVIRKGRVNGTLAVCRALGNEYLRNADEIKQITPRPKIVMLPLEEIKRDRTYLVVACDGFFEGNPVCPIASTNQVHEVVQALSIKGKSSEQISSTLVASALNAGTKDNLTVMIVPL